MLQVNFDEEARQLEKFKEQKMGEFFTHSDMMIYLTECSGQTLDYNVRLSELQQRYSRLAAKTLERNTYVQNIEERLVEKRLLISNIR